MKDIEQTIKEVEDALSGDMLKAGHDYKLSLNGLKDMALADAIELLKEHKEHEELLAKLGYHWTGEGETLALCSKGR